MAGKKKAGLKKEIKAAEEGQAVASMERVRTMFNWVADGIALTRLDERGFCFVNDPFCAATGYSREELIGMSIEDLLPPETIPLLGESFKKHAPGKMIAVRDIPIRRKDGSVHYVEIKTEHVNIDGTGYLVGIFRDITERKRAEEALREREHLLSTIIDNFPGPLSRVGRDLHYLFINPVHEEWFGLSPEAILDITIPEILDDEAFKRTESYATRALFGERVTFENTFTSPSGKVFHGLVTYVPDVGPEGNIEGFFISVADITERKRAEEVLRRSEEEMKLLSHKLLTVQEEERAWLSRELHDQMGKRLTALAMETEYMLLQKRIGKKSVRKLSELIVKASAELRGICKGLRPMELDDFGLKTALETLVNEYAVAGGLEARLDIEAVSETDISRDCSISIYRVVQESLTNILRHAGASSVRISVAREEGCLTIIVTDDGKGFDPGKTHEGEFHFGLLGMKERALLCGGNVDIISQSGKGTSVIMRAPLSPDKGKDTE